MSIWGIGIETMSLPLRPMSSPCETYLRRFCRILPRTMARNREWSWSIFSDMFCFSVAHESSAWPHSLNDLDELTHQVGPLHERPNAQLLQELDVRTRGASADRYDHARVAEVHSPQQHAHLDPVDVGQVQVQEQKVRHPPPYGA